MCGRLGMRPSPFRIRSMSAKVTQRGYGSCRDVTANKSGVLLSLPDAHIQMRDPSYSTSTRDNSEKQEKKNHRGLQVIQDLRYPLSRIKERDII